MIKKKTTSFIKTLPQNIFAGFVVSLIALPLGLGLAIASEAPPISGIIASVAGGVVVAVFGGSKVTITGPGNGLVIVLLGAITTLANGDMHQGYLYTIAAVVASGVLMLLLGFLRMGTLADFFPSSAINGMLAAIGIGIFAKQIHVMLGNQSAKGSIAELLLKIPEGVIHLIQTNSTSVLMAGLVGIGSLFIMVFYAKIRNKYFQLVPAPMWIIVLAISLRRVFDWLGITYPMEQQHLINIPNDIVSSLATPDFSIAYQANFIGVVLAITLISSIESLLSIKAVDKLDPLSRRSNANRDLKALGFASVVSGFLGGLNVVTVIARSSVNVNNGATNRWSNFFHAFFLVLFILLLQNELKSVPLSALAAILVYTGYKLADPQKFAIVYRIGTEQLLIFLATLLTTIFTNLIAGILIGMLTTFVVHILINKSVKLFISNAFKPNVLLFKEHDTGNYFVSVKHFSSFLNFFMLKKKLNAIPETADAILDFSLCSFVDHTVMENLNDYQQSFEKKGGNIDIIGLDDHSTDSVHPFAMRTTAPFIKLIPASNTSTKRQKLLDDIAQEWKWEYSKERDANTSFLKDFVYFKTRQINFYYNHLFYKKKDIHLFDFEFSEGAFIAQEIVRSTAMVINLHKPIPLFTLDKEGLLEMLYRFSGFDDIPIDEAPDFSNRFFLRGPDEHAIKQFFNKDLIHFFESNPYYHIESNGESLFIIKKERLASVKEIKAMMDFGKRLCKVMSKSTVMKEIKMH